MTRSAEPTPGPTSVPPPGSDPASIPAAVAFVLEALRPPPGPDGIRIITVPAPLTPPERLLEAEDPAVFWTTPGAPVQVGLGIARAVTAGGADRFRSLRSAADRLWPLIETVSHPDAAPPRPRLFGGFAFLPGPPTSEWRSFGEATFVLPRLLYTRDGERAHLSLAVTAEGLASRGAGSLAAEVEELLNRLGKPALSEPALSEPETGSSPGSAPRSSAPAGDRPPPPPSDADDADRAAWRDSVASIQRRIATGRAEKIVAARSRVVPLPAAGLPEILRCLERESATAARFAFRLGAATFVGATPERLVSRSGRKVRTEALAGTVAVDTPEREKRLLASLKEGAEHRYVVRAIAGALEPLCDRLDYPAEPRVQRLLHVLHLQTPFSGVLREGVHVLELVERLHPTPAVGGLPTAEALAWIDREEPGSRGWYAAPVGWFDDSGDGDFGVALRSGLLDADRAFLYAGAGIVRGSDPADEFEETEVKLRTMLDALGSAR